MLAPVWRGTQTLFPLLCLIGLLWVLWTSLFLNPRELPSPLINTPIPEALFANQGLPNKPAIIHFFSNGDQKELIQKITQKWPIPFYGVGYKLDSEDFKTLLHPANNPYQWVVQDEGKIGIELGVCTTPEFYIIDSMHHIRYKHSGPLSTKIFETIFMPILSDLSGRRVHRVLSNKRNSIPSLVSIKPGSLKIYERLIKEFRCVTCQNQSLADSSAPIAISMREAIYTKVHEGKTEKQIKQFLVARYGDYVLYNPPVKKETWLLWGGPFLLLLIGIGVGISLFTQDSVKYKER